MQWPELCEISSKCKQHILEREDEAKLATLGYAQLGSCDALETFSLYRQNPKYHMLLYTTHGVGLLHTQDESFRLEAGSLIVVPKGCANGFEMDCSHWSVTWVMLDGRLKWPLQKKSGAYLQSTTYGAVLRHTIESLVLSGKYCEFDDPCLHNMLVEQLQHIVSSSLQKKTQLSAVQMRLQHFTYLLSQQLHKDWTVEQMAALIYCSPAHLYRLTNQWLAKTPMQHLQDLRIEQAKQSLALQHWSIQDIAQQVGFKDLANFSRRFKTLVGKTPTAYRTAKRAE
ncbi:AraC family transcriptional regulator [Psychromonas aquimarina]|uniref:AraC family transcriptional regulator n=1 Tax=Psychromonas aquimarina TaxID=444919 RepID=UPI0004153912|nr:AraC family transcriptional regulator [Psychromonas aquimarina]